MGIQRVSDIAQILRTRSDIKAKEGVIIWMFMRYLESLGFKRGEDFDIESNLNNVDVDIVIYDNNKRPVVIVDVIEPSNFSSLRDENFVKLVERVLVRSYIYALKPEFVVVTDGLSIFVYDKNGLRINELSSEDLSRVDNAFETRFRSILLRWNNRFDNQHLL